MLNIDQQTGRVLNIDQQTEGESVEYRYKQKGRVLNIDLQTEESVEYRSTNRRGEC